MQISALWQALRRRLVLLLAVVAVACAAAGFAWFRTTTLYDATAVAVVVPGVEKAIGSPSNPLDKVGYATTQLATLSTVVATSPSLQREMTERTGATLVSATNTSQERTSAPQPGIQILVTTRGSSPETAVAGATTAVKLMDTELQRLQQQVNVPAKERARVVDFVKAQPTMSSSRSRLRAAGGVFVGIVGLGTVAVLGGDALLQRRRQKVTSDRRDGRRSENSTD